MKRLRLMALFAAVLLSGCTAQTPELLIVKDEVETFPDSAVKYSIRVELPDGMTEAVSGGAYDERIYESEDGTYFVVTQILRGCRAEDAIRQMTGYDPENLGMIRTESSSVPEYRFSWCANGENGILTCSGIVAEDDAYCYCLSFCAEEQYAKACASAREQVMSGFGLYYDEGF